MTRPRPAGADCAQRGAGAIGTSTGVLVVLLLLVAAVQILFDLYATTMVTAAAHDAARAVASVDAAGDRCTATGPATDGFVAALGDYGRGGHARLEWTCDDPDLVMVRVRATHPTILPPRLAGLLGLGRLDRTIVVAAEAQR